MKKVAACIAFAVLVCLVSFVEARAQDSNQSIFNGKDLTGWKGNPSLWSVEDGAITGRTSDDKPIPSNTFLIWDAGEVGDFELELDYQIGDAGNSGIQYRSKILDEDGFVVGGYQADIDVTLQFAGINYEEKGRGILAQRGQRVTYASDGTKQEESFADGKELGKKIRKGDWNHYRIVANGNKLSHYINGQLMSEVIDNQEGKSAASGVLAFQLHRGPAMVIRFKNIQLKTLH